MMKQALQYGFAATAILAVSLATGQGKAKPEWQEEFGISSCTLQTTGRNEYFILEPGHQLVLEGGPQPGVFQVRAHPGEGVVHGGLPNAVIE